MERPPAIRMKLFSRLFVGCLVMAALLAGSASRLPSGTRRASWRCCSQWDISRCSSEDDREHVLREVADGDRRKDESWSMEFRMIRKDGSVAWVREEARILREKHARMSYWQGVILISPNARRPSSRWPTSRSTTS